jgi:hypothetical protein
MSTFRPRAIMPALLLAFGLVLSAGTALAASPVADATSGATALAIAQGRGPTPVVNCALQRDPLLPIELGSAVSGGLTKTVAMEKELFKCQSTVGANPDVIRDLETLIDVVQARDGKLIAITVELVTCDRRFPVGTIACAFRAVPLGPVTQNPLEGCSPDGDHFPNDPVEMNVVANGRTIKTIKLDKEWYRCPDGQRELYSFAETIETLRLENGNPVGFATTLRRTFGVVCVKDTPRGIIVGCRRFRTL